jgi:hypothetical protein
MTVPAADTQVTSASSCRVSKPMMTGKRWDCRSQSRLFWIVGRVPAGWSPPGLVPRPTLRTSPLNTRPGSTSNRISTGVPTSTWPRLFSVNSALIQTSSITISVSTGLPVPA